MKPYAYYNEWDDYAAQWLRNLMAEGLIMEGEVDTRSITEVQPEDLKGFTQCHFFAGIGGWSRALRLAGWPDNTPVWSGSTPCQPFSTAGKQLGVLDERHLAPHFLSLVTAVRPAVLFGEQVSAAVNKDNWLDDLLDALEREGYATGAAVLPACGVSAPHIRQRLWFVAERMADATHQQHDGAGSGGARGRAEHPDGGDAGGMAHPNRSGRDERKHPGILVRTAGEEPEHDPIWVPNRLGCGGADGGMAHPMHPGRPERRAESGGGQVAGCGEFGGVDNPASARHDGQEQGAEGEARDEAWLRVSGTGCGLGGVDDGERTRETHGFWDAADWLFCRDGKWRPVEPGTFPLAHGVSNRVGRLRAYGNAIVPQAAAEIIGAYLARDRLRRAMTLDFDEM